MEIEIESKRNNPLLNRTEVYFIVKHPGEGTPNREIIRSELADKLNVNKENIVVNTVKSGFGIQESSGYAKVYSSVQKTKNLEQDYILTRNKLIEKDKKNKKEAAPAPTGEGAPKTPDEKKPEEPSKPLAEKPKDETSEPATKQEPPVEEKPTEEKSEESTNPEKTKEEKKEE